MSKEIGIKEIVTFLKKIKTEEDFIATKMFKKEFKEKSDEADKIFKEQGEVCFMDEANVCLIVLKSERLINLALGVFGKDIEFSNKPQNFSYKIDIKFDENNKLIGEVNEEICCKYSGEYLQIILELCKYGSPKIYLRRDYPIKVELEEIGLDFILAPRICED